MSVEDRNRLQGPATLRDVAMQAGVSEATVSRALRDDPRVAMETRARVQEVAQQLHYRPNALARSLATQRSQLVGVVVPNVTNPLYTEVVEGIESTLFREGYTVVFCDSHFDLEREDHALQVLWEQRVAGIIVAPIDSQQGHLHWMPERGMPNVWLDSSDIPLLDINQVAVDDGLGAYLACQHLLALGHRRIALINGPTSVLACAERLKGYERALTEQGVTLDAGLIAEGNLVIQGGYEAALNLLRRRPDLTAIFCANDAMAIGALKALREAKLAVPEQVSLVGCDDIPVAEQLQPALTTVWQPKYELGQIAARILLSHIRHAEAHPNGGHAYAYQRVLLQPRLIVRSTTAPSPQVAEDAKKP